MRIALTGDVMLGRNAGLVLDRTPPEHVWGDVLPAMREADLRLVNLECVIAMGGAPIQPKVFHFRAPPAAIAALQAARVDAVTLANNHVLDYGPGAFLEMLDLLDAAGIPRVGAGRDADEAWRPVFLDAQGVRVGIMAFTDNEARWETGRNRPGTAYLDVDLESAAAERFLARVADAAGACDVLVVSAHWGPNMREDPPPHFQRFARAALDAGATLWWGHSAHVFQGVERRGQGMILYDTGDFVDDYAVDPDLRNDLSFLFELDVDARRVRSLALLPTAIDARACQARRAKGFDDDWAVARMVELSAPFGTRLVRDGARLWEVTPVPSAAHETFVNGRS